MAYQSINPWTGEKHPTISYLSRAEVEQALTQSESAARHWQQMSFQQRGALFHRLAEVLRKHEHRLANAMTEEMGKLSDEALAEVIKAADACDYYAIKSEKLLADEIIHTDYDQSLVRYQPLGCVLGVMPWNFPIWQVIRFIAPTMMAGNVCLLKHAENVPHCAELLAELIDHAGFPPGSFQNLFIDNETTASVISDSRCHGVSLTGSEAAGRSIAATAGKHLKKHVMELGGSDPFMVLADADLDQAAETAAVSRFMNAGQVCIAAKRFIVLDSIADAFIEKLAAHAAQLACDNPADPATTLAPLARADLAAKLQHQVDLSVQLGAKAICGCKRSDRQPTAYPASILDNVNANMPVFYEEVFGPVAAVIRVADHHEAVAVANQSNFGLAASIWSSNSTKAMEIAEQLEAGSVFINSLVKSDVRLPFGGIKHSGYGRELALLGIREFTNAKTIVMNE